MTPVAFDSLAGAALHALWSGLVDTAAFALVVEVANVAVRPSAATRHKLWWLVIVLAVAVPLASFATSLGRVRTISRPPAAAPMKTIATVRSTAHFPASAARRAPAAAAEGDAAPPATPRIDVFVSATIVCGAILGMWIAIALYKNVELAIEIVALARVKRRAKALDAATVAALRAFRANAGTHRRPALSVSDDVKVPCAAGLFAPAILFPAHVVASAPASDIDRIAMHEYAHLRRFDDWTNLAERVANAFVWFNPAVALAKRRIAIDREIACDDWVVERTGGAHGYASCLFRLAAARGVARMPAQALGALGDSTSIAARIEHLVAEAEAPHRTSRALPTVLSVLALGLIVGQAMRAPAIAVEATAIPLATPATASPATASPSPSTRVVPPPPLQQVRPLPSIPPLPRLPHVTPLASSDDADLDAAIDRVRREAEAMAERALERAERERERADAEAFRAQQRQLAAQIKARISGVDMRRDQVRAALEIVEQTERVRRDAIAHALQDLRGELENEPKR